MKIKEYFTKGKIDDIKNEDGIFIGHRIIAVIDGVTSKTDNLYNGFKSGKVAKDIIMRALENIKPEQTFENVLLYLNSELNRYHKVIGKDNEWFGAQIIMYNDYYKEIWNFGDCNCMINGVFHNHDKVYDGITSNARALYNNILLRSGFTEKQLLENDYGAHYIQPLLKKQYLFDNDDSMYGYPVLNGKGIHLKHIIKYKVKDNDEIVLASDGYPVIKSTLKESEEYLNNILTNDPLCIKEFISTKGLDLGNNSYDDRTYVRFII